MAALRVSGSVLAALRGARRGVAACGIRGAMVRTPLAAVRHCSAEAEAASDASKESKLMDVPDVNDPERPEEDELARAHRWHAVLWWHWDNEQRLLWDRMDRVKDASLLVMTVQAFSANKAHCDELFEGLEKRFLTVIPDLPAASLSLLAWAYGRHRGTKGSPALWDTIAARLQSDSVGSFTKQQAAALLMAYEASGRPGADILPTLKGKLQADGGR